MDTGHAPSHRHDREVCGHVSTTQLRCEVLQITNWSAVTFLYPPFYFLTIKLDSRKRHFFTALSVKPCVCAAVHMQIINTGKALKFGLNWSHCCNCLPLITSTLPARGFAVSVLALLSWHSTLRRRQRETSDDLQLNESPLPGRRDVAPRSSTLSEWIYRYRHVYIYRLDTYSFLPEQQNGA